MFKLVSDFKPSGDQPAAIKALMEGFGKAKYQTLLGVTGSGKTFTMANMISQLNRPVLILSHNKTLAAQLYSEFKAFFPENAVEYFVSYYDYYLPEAYIPQTDTYIAKDASINENIERLRLSASSSLVERKDVILIASVSCIYGLGSPEDFQDMCVTVDTSESMSRDDLLHRLIDIQYERNDIAPEAGEFRVRGDSIDVFAPQKKEFVRVEFWGDEIENISRCDIVTGNVQEKPNRVVFFPCRHFVMPRERVKAASSKILKEMNAQVRYFEQNGLLVEAQRLYQRTMHDIEMMK
jgi:excinuclease ABC subunit B